MRRIGVGKEVGEMGEWLTRDEIRPRSNGLLQKAGL